jgi:hypothetical protein
MNTSQASSSPSLKILVVTCDMPSHAYAAAKLAKVIDSAGHAVRLAAPKGSAFDRCRDETMKTAVECITVGTVSTDKHMSERPVINPHSLKVLFGAFRKQFPLVEGWSALFDHQEGMYEAIKQELESNNYDVVIPIHSCFITVFDAVEAIGSSACVVIFSSLPYDPALYLGEREAWWMPRSLTTFPHVSTYSATPSSNPLLYLLSVMWKLLDAWFTARAWARSTALNNARRKERELPPLACGYEEYLRRYPVISFGGVFPFLDCRSKVAPNVTAVGSFDSAPTALQGDLANWVDHVAMDEIVYAGFGTGTELSEQEAAAVVEQLMQEHVSPYPVLFALQESEQKRLRSVFDRALRSKATGESESHL